MSDLTAADNVSGAAIEFDFDEIVSTARSVRKKIDFERAIERDDILQCIDLAIQAPTSVGDETWRFVVISDAERKSALANIYQRAFDHYLETKQDELSARGVSAGSLSPNYRYLADNLHQFPALVVVCRTGRPPSDTAGQLAFYGSVIPAAWSLMLAFRSRRIGATWTTLHAVFEHETAAAIGMPADATAAIMLPIGYLKGANMKRAARAPATAVTYWEQWPGE